MDKGGHYDVQMKRWLQNVQIKKGGWIRVGIMWKSKCGCKRRCYDVQIKRVDR